MISLKTSVFRSCAAMALLVAMPSAVFAAYPQPAASQGRPGKVWQPPTTAHSASTTARAASSGTHIAPSTAHSASAHVAGRAAFHAATSSPHGPTTSQGTPAKSAASAPEKIPAFEPPPPMASLATMSAAGKALIQRQQVRAKLLRGTTGYANVEELVSAVAAMGPNRARAVEVLRDEGSFEFAMRAPEGIRESLTASGFLNQHDTGRSGGNFNPARRGSSEASMIGLTEAEYAKVPNALRPKFGFLRPSPKSGLHSDETAANHYGSDVFIFKTDALKEHVTFYPDNSLGKGPDTFGATAGTTPASAWHQLFQPWSERMLLAASLEVFGGDRVSFSAQVPARFQRGRNYGSYFEIQIWKPLGVSDIARFEFGTTAPSGKFLEMLRKNGVKIYQRGQTEEWKGDASS